LIIIKLKFFIHFECIGELCDAVVALVDNPELSDNELLKIIPAPDFPTGGQIMGLAGAEELYKTGHGRIVLRAKCHIEIISNSIKGINRSKNAIVITELPYMTNKAALLEKIADLVNDKKLEGISDLRDESDRDGIRVVVELKRDAVPALVQNNLFKKTSLQWAFSGNMLALVDDGKQPQRITLRDSLNIFIAYRFKTLRRRASYQLVKLRARLHIAEGLLVALRRIDDVILLVKGSKDQSAARIALTSSEYGLSTDQAEAILGLRLGRLTALEEKKLQDEQTELAREIGHLEGFMMDDKSVFGLLQKETLALKKQFAVPRRSELCIDESSLTEEDLVANVRSVIMMTNSGYIKRLPIEEFEAQSRGGKGKAGARLSTDDDSVSHFFSCNDHDSILFATDKGVAYSVKAYQIPLGSRIAKGVPLPQVLPIGQNEQVTSVIPIESYTREDEHLVLMTSQGYVKKTPLKAFQNISARGLIIISLGDGDSLRWARISRPREEVLVATRDGFASRFRTGDLTSTSRTSRGVRALKLREGDVMADIDIIKQSLARPAGEIEGEGEGDVVEKVHEETEIELIAGKKNKKDKKKKDDDEYFILMVTEKGYGKRIALDEFKIQKKGA
jgi:DNA gyrase subunit A